MFEFDFGLIWIVSVTNSIEQQSSPSQVEGSVEYLYTKTVASFLNADGE